MSTQPSLLAQRSCHQICLVPPPLRTISRPPPSLRPIASRVLEQAHHPCDVTRLLTSEAGAFGLNQKRLSAAGSRVGSGSKTSFVHSGVATVVVEKHPLLASGRYRALRPRSARCAFRVQEQAHHPCELHKAPDGKGRRLWPESRDVCRLPSAG